MRRGAVLAVVSAVVVTGLGGGSAAQARFRVEEATIAEIHRAMRSGELSCRELTQAYLDRIAAYDDAGPALNAFITVNPRALETAAKLDSRSRSRGRLDLVGPLHCIPVVAKDNYDTADRPTTAGSVAFKDSPAPDDATMVKRLRDAGALVIGKTNLDELARGSSGLSSLGGQTRNAYDPARVPGGSSAGTAVAVAANFATAGLATETGVSIRNPATNNNLVGIAPTRGLDSGDGIVPISFTQDRGGPHARTVADAAALLEVVAGYDPKDPQTAESLGRGRMDYTAAPSRSGLHGARIGVVEELFGGEPAEAESAAIVRSAVQEVRGQGATVIGAVPIQAALDERLPVLDPVYPNTDRTFLRVLSDARTNDLEQRFALDRFLLTRGPFVPFATTQALADSGLGLPSVIRGLQNLPPLGLADPAYAERMLRIKALQASVLKVMADANLDALIYPMKTQPAPLIGGSSQPGRVASSGNILGSITGFPSLTVPAGFTGEGLPVGVEILGRPFTEWQLIRFASDYEAASHHRRPPASTPPLARSRAAAAGGASAASLGGPVTDWKARSYGSG